MKLNSYFKNKTVTIEKKLLGYLPKAGRHAPKLYEAMRYAVMSGGKRVRPILTLAACEAVGGDSAKVLPAACALEMIHSYSLVHDDLPCLDNDAVRRGKPTCHKKFGEATALLAGDALLTLAFKILTMPAKNSSKDFCARQLETAHFIAEAVGAPGMVGGQAVDIEYQGKTIDFATLEYINIHKSGALIAASVKAGAYLGGGNPAQVRALFRYGQSLGLLFQIVDDILDEEGYAKLLGLAEARKEAAELCRRAQKEVVFLGKKSENLSEIAQMVMERKK